MRGKRKIRQIILWISVLFLLFGFGFPGILEASRGGAPDARIITTMGQLRSQAEIMKQEEGGYQNVHCEYGDIATLCNDIKNQLDVDLEPVIHSIQENYCAYTKLRNGNFYCIDSPNFASGQLTNYPGQLGYCDGITFSCIKDGIEPPPISGRSDYLDEYHEALKVREGAERRTSIITTIVVLSFFAFIIFLFIKTKRTWKRSEPARDEIWKDTLREINSKKLYFVAFLLLIILQFGFAIGLLYFFSEYAYDSYNGLPFLAPILVLSLIIMASLGPLRQARRDETATLCWEAPASLVTLSLLWILVFLPLVLADNDVLEEIVPRSLSTLVSLAYLFSFPVLYGIGILFSLRALLHRGRLNNLHGIIMMLIYIALGFLSLGFVYIGAP